MRLSSGTSLNSAFLVSSFIFLFLFQQYLQRINPEGALVMDRLHHLLNNAHPMCMSSSMLQMTGEKLTN